MIAVAADRTSRGGVAAGVALRRAGGAVSLGRGAVVQVLAAVRNAIFRTAVMGALKVALLVPGVEGEQGGEGHHPDGYWM